MNLIRCLQEVAAPRRMQGQRYSQVAMLLLVIMGIIRGHYDYRESGRFCENSRTYIISGFGFKKRKVPFHATIHTFIRTVDFASIQTAFHKWTHGYVRIKAGEWTAIDGKSIRYAMNGCSSSYQKFVSPVSLFYSKREQVLHVEKFENRNGNEGQTAISLLEILDMEDAVLTLDALLCKKTPDSIVKNSSHYIIRVKGNQPCLKSSAGQTVVNSDPTASHREEKVAGCRPEIRKTHLYNRQNSLDGGWVSINPIVYVRREFLCGNREHKSDSLYVSDLSTDDAKRITEIRANWRIENKPLREIISNKD